MSLDSLWTQAWPWRGSLIALLVALGWAAGLRLARQPALGPAAAALGLAVGWVVTMGLVTASPRQLAERLPVLGLALAVLALVLAGLLRGRAGVIGLLMAALAVLGAAWWMAGAPMHGPSLVAALPVLAGVAAFGGAMLLRLDDATDGAKAALALLAGLLVAGGFGPQPMLAGCVAGAAIGAALAGAGGGPAVRAALAPAIAALGALPVIARGQPSDWAAAAAPLLALWLGPVIGRRLPARLGPALGWAIAAAPAIGLAWYLAPGRR
ncbi:hypothetical protein [Plastoroseomonas arctica]|uniref:Uncharacterized protein n=1 Tax=Plastoroseomonas arctica TaxID=1509237 RepID=A0AAF1KNT6_9PROT|nr:hypothetical protein [Plastoroseomonas arctica]MBR0656624.1 hypothetical protein [Plastoroseomonas arctica]